MIKKPFENPRVGRDPPFSSSSSHRFTGLATSSSSLDWLLRKIIIIISSSVIEKTKCQQITSVRETSNLRCRLILKLMPRSDIPLTSQNISGFWNKFACLTDFLQSTSLPFGLFYHNGPIRHRFQQIIDPARVFSQLGFTLDFPFFLNEVEVLPPSSQLKSLEQIFIDKYQTHTDYIYLASLKISNSSARFNFGALLLYFWRRVLQACGSAMKNVVVTFVSNLPNRK